MPYIVRRDLTAQDLMIPSHNTNEYYGDEHLVTFRLIGSVSEDTFEDDESGSVIKFQAPEGHSVFLDSIDLDWVDDEDKNL
jgi:hypothetical protein